ncbi:hypothetical protein HZB88_01845 [archaeon]|nr:hypothetical protein [archaeon]
MHIEKRKAGKRIKYFLSHSYREGQKVYKFRKYLGQDLKPDLLEERKIIAEKPIIEEIHRYKIIKDPLQVELSEEDISAIRRLEAQIPLKISHLSESQWKKPFWRKTNGQISLKRTLPKHWALTKLSHTYEMQKSICHWD